MVPFDTGVKTRELSRPEKQPNYQMRQITLTWGPRIVWPIIIFLILLVTLFTLAKLYFLDVGLPVTQPQQYGPPPEFQNRYLDHPILTYIHIIAGTLFLVLAPLQFRKKFRAKHLQLHRWSGRFLMIFGLVAAVTGIQAAVELPGFGGFSTILGSWVFGLMTIWCLILAYVRIRQRNIAAHREWIIRAFAIGLGVATQRLLIFIVEPMQVTTFEEMFAPLFWFATTINLVVAETWINVTRTKK